MGKLLLVIIMMALSLLSLIALLCENFICKGYKEERFDEELAMQLVYCVPKIEKVHRVSFVCVILIALCLITTHMH